MQEVIEAFKVVYKEDERKCKERQEKQGSSSSANSFASGFAFGNGRDLLEDDAPYNNTAIDERGEGARLRSSYNKHGRRLALKWHPFHPDVQKTVHFWGYSGSFTEPPCTKDSVDWKVMDVPTPISQKQLAQLKQMLFGHVGPDCRRTSVHNARGSVARPTQDALKYYKCTRDDYVSDEERAVCGDGGCVNPFGAGLNEYYPPLVDVTGPPTRSPSK